MDNLTHETISEVYAQYGDALSFYRMAEQQRIMAKSELEFVRCHYVAEGKIPGKNQGERDANERLMLSVYYRKLEQAEYDAAVARLSLDLAENKIKETNAHLRLMNIGYWTPDDESTAHYTLQLTDDN